MRGELGKNTREGLEDGISPAWKRFLRLCLREVTRGRQGGKDGGKELRVKDKNKRTF